MVVTRSKSGEENTTRAASTSEATGTTSSGTNTTSDENTVETLRPSRAASRRSTTSQKKIEELKVKEQLAALKLKQAQAEVEAVQARLERIRAEAESSEEENSEPEELEPERVDQWLQRQSVYPQPPECIENTSGEKINPSSKPNARTKETEEKGLEQGQEASADQVHKRGSVSETSPAQQSPVIDVATLAAALTQAARNSTRDPPRYIQEMPLFTGHSNEWLAYKAAYRDTEQYFMKNENVARLRKSLRGAALDAVGCLFLSQPDPQEIIKALERRFGRPEALILAEMEKLKMLHKITDNPRDLCIFAGRVGNTVGTIEALQKTQYLYSPEMARLIVEKLTPILKSKWYDYAARKKDDVPELKKLAAFLNEEADKCGAYAAPEAFNEEKPGNERARRKPERTYTTDVKEKEDRCPLCKSEHQLPDCARFLDCDTNERWDIAKKGHVCFRCLRSKHRRFKCKAQPCGESGCQMRHHRLLHHKLKTPLQTAPHHAPLSPSETVTSTVIETTAAANNNTRRRVYLKVVPVVLRGPNTSIETHALLDEGSTITIIDSTIADVLGIDGPTDTMWIQGLGTEMKHERSRIVDLQVRGKNAATEFKINGARTVDKLDFTPQTIKEEDIEGCDHLVGIKEELIYERASPKLLIGQDNWHLIVSREVRAGRRDNPVASYTQLGWVLHGCRTSATDTVTFCGHISAAERSDPVEEMVKNYFKLESLGIEPRKQKDDPEQRAIDLLEKKSRRLPCGRYETGLLWKEDNIKIPNNYREAQKRLYSLERKLDRDEDLKKKYEERMNNLLTSGYAEHAVAPPTKEKTWYLPHFPVVNPAKPHKPPRLVHDASAKTTGLSLNDMLLPGPDLLQSLPGVIMRFRQHSYAISADIKEMFMQIKIREEDRDALRFLWRGNRREGAPEEYRMTSVIFGATSSPCTALYIKNRNASDFAAEYPQATAAIHKNHYMDDYIQSFATISEAKETSQAVDYIHKKAGFVLNGWASNQESVIKDFTTTKKEDATVVIGGSETEKTLGLLWNTGDDCIGFNVNTKKTSPEIIEGKRPPTKREALSIIMTLFDPLGLISPVTTPAKRILQDTWRYKTDWDGPLPDELQPKWSAWLASLHALHTIRIPRCYDYEPAAARQLHTFVDASEEAYAAAVYWRMQRADGSVHVALAAAKSRVTPLKPVSIPRLELQAALLGARLADSILQEHEFVVEKKVYWSDSRTALAWIRSEPRAFKTFVAHRLAEIEDTTKKNEWRWLSSSDNVADDATRAPRGDFDKQHRWFHGPAFLRLPEEQWPRETKAALPETGEEKEKCHATISQHPTVSLSASLPKIERFSKWTRLLRATGRVLQFLDFCKRRCIVAAARRKRTKENAPSDPTWRYATSKKTNEPKRPHTKPIVPACHLMNLSTHYIIRAEQLWIRVSQEESFADEIKRIRDQLAPSSGGRLATLSIAHDDDDGILRLKSRISAATDIEKTAACPVILDGKHIYTKLYIQHIHEKMHHGGVELVVNELRQRMWVIKIRPAVRDVIKSCITCKIKKAQPASPATGDLPAARLAHHARPFTYTGVDYFGPIEVTVARHHEKRHVALFTCLTSRATHLELVWSLSAASAVAALRRFIARRGCPKEIWSDNATCFKAAERELGTAALDAMDKEATTQHIAWRYIPPAAPFMGGAWERMVRAVKEALRVTLHEKYPSDETLSTLLAEAENTVNSRPLTHVPVTPETPEALTPNHILIGPNCHVPSPGHFTKDDETARQQWRRAQFLADVFWKRWVREYLPLLQNRREPRGSSITPQLGDLVVIVDPNLPRNTWPRGRITALYPGKDGVVRVVDVATSNGHILRRPTKKIVVLPVESPKSDGGRIVHDGNNM